MWIDTNEHSRNGGVEQGVVVLMETQRPLLPRYQRVLDFGALLDESVHLYRRSWRWMAAIMAIVAIPVVGLSVWTGLLAASYSRATASQPASTVSTDPLAPLRVEAPLAGVSFLGSGITEILWLLGLAVAVVLTNQLLRGVPPSAGSAFKRGLRRLPFVVILGVVYVILLGIILVLTYLLLLLTLLALAGLVPLIALLVWWRWPGARKGWLKWLIILTTPFGLVMFYAVRLSLWLPICLLEDGDPIRSLMRSNQLVRGQWFRVAGLLCMLGIVVFAIDSIPTLAVMGMALVPLVQGQTGPNPITQISESLAGAVGQILCGGLGAIGWTLIFLDARNRREGADLAERVVQLQAHAHAPA